MARAAVGTAGVPPVLSFGPCATALDALEAVSVAGDTGALAARWGGLVPFEDFALLASLPVLAGLTLLAGLLFPADLPLLAGLALAAVLAAPAGFAPPLAVVRLPLLFLAVALAVLVSFGLVETLAAAFFERGFPEADFFEVSGLRFIERSDFLTPTAYLIFG